MKNNHEKQRFCCKWNRKCCDAKCKNYNQKCKWTGKIIKTKHHWRCRMAKVGKHGQRKKMLQT